ncbi:hypothetical protein TNCT_334491 [Trichonephila clavata]|uniref:Uncharacterized protein n=1 Tax=Trichonephila clavata TaxID=2740835 RepID=A0A8X6G2M3_TRICU|nr:hypothetical protein TNCT_334491 [Trichonephila clavata]
MHYLGCPLRTTTAKKPVSFASKLSLRPRKKQHTLTNKVNTFLPFLPSPSLRFLNRIINSRAAEKDIANDRTRIRPAPGTGFVLMDQDILRHRSLAKNPALSSLVPRGEENSEEDGEGGMENLHPLASFRRSMFSTLPPFCIIVLARLAFRCNYFT